MVAIMEYANGLKFTGWIAESEEKAWAFLDEKYGAVRMGFKCPCNRNAFVMVAIEKVGDNLKD